MGKGNKIKKGAIILFIVIIILITGVVLAHKFLNMQEVKEKAQEIIKNEPKQTSPRIFNYNSKERPVAVMLDNNTNAWPHSNINNTYLIYEMEVEGGESRLMALFKDKQDVVKQVGPIRSARHYFLDYAMENDVLYAHIGQSPKAESDLKTLKMPDINGQLYDTLKPRNEQNEKEFWREKSKVRPHNAYTSIKNLFNIAKDPKVKYAIESTVKPSFKYSIDKEIELTGEDVLDATKVTGKYNNNNKTVFEYDKEKKKYTKTSKGKLQKDEASGEVYTIKNLIVLNAPTSDLTDPEHKGRKDVKTVGTLEGYYITNGKAIKIKATKDSRQGKTKYTDLKGNEIEVNDGRTYIMIVPMDEKIVVEGEDFAKESVKETVKEEPKKAKKTR